MLAVSPMHEKVHAYAEEQGQPDEQAAGQNYRSILVSQEQTARGQGEQQELADWSLPVGRLTALFRKAVILGICAWYHGTSPCYQILVLRSRSELSTTEIDEALIANAANIGLIRMPKT